MPLNASEEKKKRLNPTPRDEETNEILTEKNSQGIFFSVLVKKVLV